MAEFKLDRFKYNWKGEWTSATDYTRDDIVRVNGKSYVCLISHTASAAFGEDLNAVLPGSNPPQPQPKWLVMTSGKSFLGDWETSTDYNKGDLVLYDGTVWLCINNHSSSTFSANVDDWETFAKGIKYVGDWTSATDYGHGALVRNNGIVYKCLNAHTSLASLEDNILDWEVFYDGDEYLDAWIPDTLYRKNDVVKYGGSLYKCIGEHTSTGDNIDLENFKIFAPGVQNEEEWSDIVNYNIGDIVRYGGNNYYALVDNIDSNPGRSTDDSTFEWLLLAQGYRFRGTWNLNEVYRVGDVVQRGGQLFKAINDVNVSDGDGSTADYLDPDVWEKLAPGKVFASNWKEATLFSVGDVVYHLGTAYLCNTEHYSNQENFPGDNGNGYFYWDILIEAGLPGGLHDKGDLLTFGLSRGDVGDGSTVGDIRVAIGESQELLSVAEEQEVFWRRFLNDAEVVYVGTHGVDRADYGKSPSQPFRTIRYACEFLEDNFDPLTPTSVRIATGRYEEIGPISVPAGCAVIGDELRSTTVVATPARPEYQNKFTYIEDSLDYLTSIILNILTNVEILKSPGNELIQDRQFRASDLNAANYFVQLVSEYKNYVNFRIGDGANDPTLSGSNELNSNGLRSNAGPLLRANFEFISEELYYWLVNEYPNEIFDKVQFKSDFRSFIRGVARDLEYDGNYGVLTAARRYANAVNGSRLDDIFYMRDTTGLRQCTTEGLLGDLNPPGVYDLFQRPTGGSCVSLDPGWGPADERVWINNRSPYIQGVTNIGSNCVGQKIDGALHNGGNKSMTSNDFTQVLSDGIGAWILNNGRAELVSVFTYYCAVGYLAESGGVIRATNGNNSYGSFGSVANGNDPTETPQNVQLFNKNNEAVVETGFAGDSDDRIFIFEYENAGENYTQAEATISGAGDLADVEYTDFRDGAIFNPRLINTQGSGSEGGSNYLVRQGNAQETIDSTSTIKLSQTDLTQFEEEILGMRLLIVSGSGAGQYGYIDGYDPVSRDCTIRKESTSELGWDHIIPGYPILASLDSTARYRIEPRIEVSDPGFTSENYNLTNGRDIKDLTFGDTTESFTNVNLPAGSGDTIEISAFPAVVNITRSGITYSVSLINGGAGYNPGDILTIPGTDLGGITPDNDILLTVLTTSDDSTNSILTFSFEGRGRQGRFVAIGDPNFVVYSDDALTWNESTLSFSGDFRKIVSGNSRFIAVPNSDNKVSFSYTGESWTTRSLPITGNWVDADFGNDRFVIIEEESNNVVYSTDGLTWSSTTIPDGVGDSTTAQWQGVAYGQGVWVAISGSDRATATSTDGVTWTRNDNVLPNQFYDFCSLEYGNNRWLGTSIDGRTVYSIDGTNWYEGGTLPNNGGSPLDWRDIKYRNGIFFAIGTLFGGATDYVATSPDGLVWQERTLSGIQEWGGIDYAYVNNNPTFVILGKNATTQAVQHVTTGAKAILRANIFQGSFQTVRIWNPGSGYLSKPTITITDTQFVSEAEIDPRLGNGVLSQPDFVNRGQGYRTASSTITITGNGFADIIPEANEITVSGVVNVPGPGVQVRIETIEDTATEDPDDLFLFSGVAIVDLGDDGTGNGTRLVKITLSPRVRNEFNLETGTNITLRSRYSQCRVSGHDFLDIGTGNFQETNYPDLYSGGAYFVAAPENEVLEQNGGRVFYTSTDQDGNFRTGELFSVQQSTGVVTISAEFFDLDGLSELSLGGVRLGGSGAVVNEFSTDPTFSADSNNVVPTQRAIATFLADRLSVGGEALETNDIQAGRVRIGSEENRIESSADQYIYFGSDMIFNGEDEFGNKTDVSGTIISQMLYFRTFNDTIQ